jgi:hypothetical protein
LVAVARLRLAVPSWTPSLARTRARVWACLLPVSTNRPRSVSVSFEAPTVICIPTWPVKSLRTVTWLVTLVTYGVVVKALTVATGVAAGAVDVLPEVVPPVE